MKKENMNNKGFSLVELIIVIAIMAILIVVLAPQYLKYVSPMAMIGAVCGMIMLMAGSLVGII